MLSASIQTGKGQSNLGEGHMTPLHWRREYQVAWIAFCIVGGTTGLFFAWIESPARTMANYTMGVNPSAIFFLWLLHPFQYWTWPLFGVIFVGLTFYAAMLIRAQK